jgi:hypothetical protein
MKRIAIALALSLVVVLVMGVPALGAGHRMPVATLTLELRCGNTSGGGSVLLYDSKAPNRVQMEVILTGALPNRNYDVICSTYQWDGTSTSNYLERTLGTVTTNSKGDAKGAYTASVAVSGDYQVRIDLRLDGDLLQYSAASWPGTIAFD